MKFIILILYFLLNHIANALFPFLQFLLIQMIYELTQLNPIVVKMSKWRNRRSNRVVRSLYNLVRVDPTIQESLHLLINRLRRYQVLPKTLLSRILQTTVIYHIIHRSLLLELMKIMNGVSFT